MEREESIVQACEDLFYSKGFHAVSVDEIGERAGMSGPAIYRHFAGKEEILVMLFDRALDQLFQSRRALPEDPRERLAFLAHTHIGFVLKHHKLASIWIREDRGLPRDLARAHHQRSREYIDEWIACAGDVYPAAAKDDVAAAVYCVIGMANSIAMWPRSSTKFAGVRPFLNSMVLSGLEASLGAHR